MKQIRTAICLIAIAFLGVFAMAQTPTGTIQGVVTDKTGAAVQGDRLIVETGRAARGSHADDEVGALTG